MPTSTRAFLDIAERHGIDPSDPAAVQHWYTVVLPTLPIEQIEEILEELLGRDATTEDRSDSRCYPEGASLPPLDGSPPAPAPLLAARWRALFRILGARLLRGQRK